MDIPYALQGNGGKPCLFFDKIPLELRNIIYHFLLRDNKTTVNRARGVFSVVLECLANPAVCTVSKQFAREYRDQADRGCSLYIQYGLLSLEPWFCPEDPLAMIRPAVLLRVCRLRIEVGVKDVELDEGEFLPESRSYTCDDREQEI